VVVAGLAFTDWWEPYSWIAVVAFVPWWFAFVVRVGDGPGGVDRRRVVVGAVIGGLIAMTYYYPFFIGAVQLVVVLAVGEGSRRRGGVFPLRIARESWCVLVGTGLVSAPFWAPLALRAVSSGAFDSLQNRFFEPWMIPFHLPFLEPTIPGAVMLFGLVSIALGSRRSPLLLGLAMLLGSAYAWFVLGYVMVLAETPILAFKTAFVIDAVLVAGAGIGAVSLARSVADGDVGRRFPSSPLLRGGGLAAIVLVLTASAVGAIPYVREQRAAHEPTTLLRAYDRATAGRPDGDVVLTGEFELSFFRPVFLFNVWNAHYSNPTAEFTARSRFLSRLASERDPGVVAAALRHNRYDAVDVVLLRREGDALGYVDYQDNFPRGTRRRTLSFSTAQFDDRWFARSVVGDHVVFVARSNDPMGSLDAAERRELERRFAGDLSARNRPTAG
jgi:hypothetical protein